MRTNRLCKKDVKHYTTFIYIISHASVDARLIGFGYPAYNA